MNRLTRSITPQRFLPLLAILWLALLLPGLGSRYSFGFDSSQFDRAVSEFDIARHQPHPPGYPLWVLALRALSPILGNPNQAQSVLALMFTVAALWFFHLLARDLLGDPAGLAATCLLAFSPVVCLNANTSQVYAVDLFVSCFSGWLAGELWAGRTGRAAPGLAIVALAGGFRPSGAVLMLPLLCIALWRAGRGNPVHAALGALAGAVCWLAWLTPTALLTGGFTTLASLNHEQFSSSFRNTSVLYGAPAIIHLHHALDACICFAMALFGFMPLLAGSLRPRRAEHADSPFRARPVWGTPVFFAAWMAPHLVLIYVFHFTQPGYILLSLPPLALLCAWLARGALNRLAWIGAGLAAIGLVSLFPYERFVTPSATTLPLVLLRSTPRISGLIEYSQREIRTLIDAMPGAAEEKLLICLRGSSDAPNIRTASYDFSDVAWADYYGRRLRVFAPRAGGVSYGLPASIRSVAWLCDGAGLPPALRERFPQARRVAGNVLYSFWTAPLDEPQLERILTPPSL